MFHRRFKGKSGELSLLNDLSIRFELRKIQLLVNHKRGLVIKDKLND